MRINRILNIEIHSPESEEEVKKLGFGYLSTFSFFGNTLIVINTQSDWGYFLKSEYDAENQKCKVSVSMFGRLTPVEVEFDQIELVD